MSETVHDHTTRLRMVWATVLLAAVAAGAAASLVDVPEEPPLSQGDHLLWVFVILGVVNLVTIMPAYRAMLAGPRRVFAVSGEPGPLLHAHGIAHVVATLRVALLAVFGAILLALAAHRDWFWIFDAVTVVGLLLLWPRQGKVTALVRPDPQRGGPGGPPLRTRRAPHEDHR